MLGDKQYNIYEGDSLTVLKTLPDDSVDTVVTSPPYWGLRAYLAGDAEIGREETPLEYVAKLRDVFHEVKRVLKPTGTLWLNLGDTYNGNKKGNTEVNKNPELSKVSDAINKKEWKGIPPKSLIGIPWRVAFALQDDGWVLRSDIVWCLSGGTYVWTRTQKGDMPMLIKDLARLRPETVKLWNGEKWTQLLGIGKSVHQEDKQGLLLRSGERIYCTDSHKFPVIRDGKEILLEAKNIRNGDILKKCILPEPDKAERPIYLTDDIAWLIGLYMADGSRSDDMLQFALNTGRKNYYLRIREAVEKLGCHAYKWEKGNRLHVNVSGKVINAIIDEFIGGDTAYGKHFTPSVWMLKNECLKKIMEGYLDGDGHFDVKNNRFQLGLCRNIQLERDLRIMAARLGASIILKLSRSQYTYKGEKKEVPSYEGEWRWETSSHGNNKSRNEVIGRVPISATVFYDLTVADEPHVFALASGILTHNCKPNPLPNSAPDRCSSSHEYLFMFSKEPSGYYFDYEAIEEPAKFDKVIKSKAVAQTESLFGEEEAQATPAPYKTNIKFGGTKYPDSKSGADNTYSGNAWTPKTKGECAVRRKRDVWSIPTKGYSGAHFATFPEKLVEPCILAGCPKGGIVMDVFSGAATTGVVALKNGRRYLGIELNPEYIKLSHERISKETAQQTFGF